LRMLSDCKMQKICLAVSMTSVGSLSTYLPDNPSIFDKLDVFIGIRKTYGTL